MPLASIMVASTDVDDKHLLVLLDSDQAGAQAASRINEAFHDECAVLMLGKALNLAQATIEDLVPRDVYATAGKQAGYEFTLNTDEQNASTNVEAMKQAFRRQTLGNFGIAEKATIALALINAWGKEPSRVSEYTREKACALIQAINDHFDQLT